LKDTHQALVDYAIAGGKVLTVRTHAYLSREREYIDEVLSRYLKDVGLIYLQNQVSYCLHELAGNANKANTKRLYFKDLGLNIGDAEEYNKGMKNFKADTVEQVCQYSQKQKLASLYIRFDFIKRDDYLIIRVRNNSLLTKEEVSKIDFKMEMASRYNSLVEAYSSVEDSTEGAGLGIVMMVIMLRSLGFGDEVLRIQTTDQETVAELVLDTKVEIDEEALQGIA
jgi:hypothetical protein